MHDILIFIALLIIAGGHHKMQHLANSSRFSSLADSHPVVKKLVHPTVIDSIKDYGIHFVIYSGYVLSHNVPM